MKSIGSLVLAVWLLCPGWALHAESLPPAEGGQLPDIVLPVPTDAALSAYLGLDAKERFRIPEIEARLVILQLFSMY